MSIRKAVLVASTFVALTAAMQAQAAEVFGRNGQGHFIPAYDFHPENPACPLQYDANFYYYATGSGGAYCNRYDAELRLPEGANIYYYAAFYKDNDASNDLTITIQRNYASYFGGDTPSYSQVPYSGFTSSGASAGFQVGLSYAANSSTFINHTYDTYIGTTNVHQDYAVRAVIPTSTALTFRGVWVFFYRQVAPAPASATFTDVPTSHPFFNEVQQLVKAGVTNGCGGSNFCPDAAVTRGQMAAFLTRALALHWDYTTDAGS